MSLHSLSTYVTVAELGMFAYIKTSEILCHLKYYEVK